MSTLRWLQRWNSSVNLDAPLRWRKVRQVEVVSDLFHEQLLDGDIAAVFGVMALAPQHSFIVLTKRAKRMREWATHPSLFGEINDALRSHGIRRVALPTQRHGMVAAGWPLPNVILGVSVEDQATADERIPDLLATPAACRVASYEPALGSVDFRPWLAPEAVAGHCISIDGDWWHAPGSCRVAHSCCRPPLSWIIVGGESGPGARPCDVAWIRTTVRACREARVPCYVGFRDRKGGDPSEWPEDLRVREWPT